MLILALSLMLFMLVLGLALLGSRVSQLRAAAKYRDGASALAIAEAGLEDARLKLERDHWYPVPNQDERPFVYAEQLLDVNGASLGYYEVTVDRSLGPEPTFLLQIESVGYVGTRENPRAVRRLRVEFDLSPDDRSTPANNNPLLYRYRNRLDGGSL